MSNTKTLDDLAFPLDDDSWVWKDDMVTFPDNDPQAIWFVVFSDGVTVHYNDGSIEKMTMQQAEHLFK